MKRIPVMDHRTEEELIAELRRKAAAYVPQWRYEPDQPDVGAALAAVYARMQYDTLKSYNQLFLKYQTEFFNALHISMKPAVPASGFVTFQLVNSTVDGVELPAGTVLTTSAVREDGEAVPLETRDDVYVSPVTLGAVYESYDGLDYIGRLYEDTQETREPFSLFRFEEENLQEHEFYIGHSFVCGLRTHGTLKLQLSVKEGELVEEQLLSLLADPESCDITYSNENGWWPFAACRVQDGALYLEKHEGQPVWEMTELDEIRMYWLRIRVKDGRQLTGLGFREMELASFSAYLKPESIYANGVDCSLEEYFPFGEQFSVYNEVYFASDEVFTKAGALVQLSFWLEFMKIPLNGLDREKNIDWKLIMQKNRISVEREYDISIAEVIWEYFNGNGWVRLFSGKEYGELFGVDGGTFRQKKLMCFTCPRDMKPVTVNGLESRYIRARVLKVNNAFKIQGQYISPVLTETRLEYEYPDRGCVPEWFCTVNNCSREMLRAGACLKQMYPFRPVIQTKDARPTLYIGTELPWEKGPLRLLFLIRRAGGGQLPTLVWQYESGGKWKELNPADETEYFSRSGLVTFAEPEKMQKTRRFGRELYWLRLVDLEGGYEIREQGRTQSLEYPVIEAIHENAVQAWTVRDGFEEYLTLERYQDHASFQLVNSGIYRLTMWERVQRLIPEPEKKRLYEQDAIREKFDGSGQLLETWVRWEEVDGFYASGREDRHYMLDANQGILSFGSGGHGKVPAPGILNGIHVEYSVGSGSEGNVPVGAVTGLDMETGFISQVTNPNAFFGGCGRETAAEAMERAAGEIQHGFRAVTSGDYEKLAREAAGNIQMAECFGGRNPEGKLQQGQVTLVLLPKQFETSLPFFPKLREQVMDYMKDKLPAGLYEQGRFHIQQPTMVQIQVRAEFTVTDFNQIFSCRKEILKRLETFLHPVTGNFDGGGFRIGRLPSRNQIDTILKSMDQIVDMRDLIITGAVFRDGEWSEISMEEAEAYPYALPVSGRHRIMIRTDR